MQTHLIQVQVGIDDMGPEQLKGYGLLDDSASSRGTRIQDDLTRLLDRTMSYLTQGLGRDLSERLARLDAGSKSVESLATLDRIVTRWQLVEYRPTLDMIVTRLESPCFEVAVFGRVSSGKSSLLNHIVGLDVLARRRDAGDGRARPGWNAERSSRPWSRSPSRGPVTSRSDQLWEYASEEGNPGNAKHVTAIVVTGSFASPESGVVLVDTPGVGSLATSGAAEAIAYLPRCDLGIVLIDGGSSLASRRPRAASDALRGRHPGDGSPEQGRSALDVRSRRMASYIESQIRAELGLNLPVHPGERRGRRRVAPLRWFDSEISPLFEQNRSLVEASIRRKIASLSESVATSLETMLLRGGASADRLVEAGLTGARQRLDQADSAIRQARQQVLDWSANRDRVLELILQLAAQAAAGRGDSSPRRDDPLFHVARDILAQRAAMAHDLVACLGQALRASLEGLRGATPLAGDGIVSNAGMKPAGLPIPDLDRFHVVPSRLRTWWASFIPRLAVRAARRRIEEQLGEALVECVNTYDRQLQAWAEAEFGRLVEHYELEAAPVREQVRRLASDEASSVASVHGKDKSALEADLRGLRGAGQSGDASALSLACREDTPGATSAILEPGIGADLDE